MWVYTQYLMIFLIYCQFSFFMGMAFGNLDPNQSNRIDDTFLYFGYGSNLLSRRIHILNPTATRQGVGELKNFRLDFYSHTSRWNGSPATVVEDEGSSVWGALWNIDMDQMENLDRQEGVDTGMYKVLMIPIQKSPNKTVTARAYQLVNNPTDKNHGGKPSETYINVIIKGAEETGLPKEYIEGLKMVEHNGNLAHPSIIEALNLESV